MTTASTETLLPVAELADIAAHAASLGVALPYYLGILALQSAYGAMHPAVVEFRNNLLAEANDARH